MFTETLTANTASLIGGRSCLPLPPGHSTWFLSLEISEIFPAVSIFGNICIVSSWDNFSCNWYFVPGNDGYLKFAARARALAATTPMPTPPSTSSRMQRRCYAYGESQGGPLLQGGSLLPLRRRRQSLLGRQSLHLYLHL